jgi:hypothetical protein
LGGGYDFSVAFGPKNRRKANEAKNREGAHYDEKDDKSCEHWKIGNDEVLGFDLLDYTLNMQRTAQFVELVGLVAPVHFFGLVLHQAHERDVKPVRIAP